jgi:hypothetical protein
MIELARAAVLGATSSSHGGDTGGQSPLPTFFETGLIADARLAIVLEPTDCIPRGLPGTSRRG